MPREVLPKKLVVAVAWLVATALAGVVAWTAVSRLGFDSGGSAARPLSGSDVRARLSRATAVPEAPRPTVVRPTRSSAPSGRAAGTPPGASRSTAPLRSRSWQLTGGTVAVSCRGTTIKLLYASPLDGWAYRVDPQPPRTVAVEFSDGRKTAGLSAECRNGAPVETRNVPSGDLEGNDGGPDD